MDTLQSLWYGPGRALLMAAVAIVIGLVAHTIFFRIYARLGRRNPALLPLEGELLRRTRGPLRLLFPLIAIFVVLPVLEAGLSEGLYAFVADVLYILTVAGVAWLFINLVRVMQTIILHHYDVEAADNLMARKVVTQVAILRRVLIVAIVIVAVSAVLLHYEQFRELGTGLLASAGIAGIVVGFAAQRTLGNLFAGFQIAITQPIRVDDVVIVEGEWGRIEEITLTYVVVRIWDLRRLVVPISYFIERPFQNWTRTSAEILGTVFLYVDYTVPVEAVRQELHRLLEANDLWDGQVWRLHVTDTTDRIVELRALMSAADAGSAFELRAAVREQLVDFLQREYPDALPRLRTSLDAPLRGTDAAA